MTGTLNNGFEFTIDEKIAEDWEFVEALSEAESNQLKTVKVIKMLLGEKQTNALKNYLGGKPKASEMFNAVGEMLNVIAINKKK